MATWADIKGNRISFLRIIVGFLPLAFGCFLSVLFQRTDSIVADDLIADLAIGGITLWILTAAFLVAFAACLLPFGSVIDRFGPRAVQSVMMGVTALGALIFSLSTGPFSLAIGRVLLGVGAASTLLATTKAIVTWCPRERLGLVTGCFIAAAALGALAAGPAALFVRAYGWGTLFILLAALATICAILTALLVPTPATVTGDVPDQDHGLAFVVRDPIFGQFALLAAVLVGTTLAMQGKWVAGWLAAASGLEITDVRIDVSLIAVGQIAGALVCGALADWAVRKGLSAASLFVCVVALCICIQLAAIVGMALPASIVLGASLAGAAIILPFVVLLTHFPQAYAARACASLVVLQLVASLFIRWAIAIVVAIWPVQASGQTSATAYATAFMVAVASQCAALAWYLFGRSETRDGAQRVEEIAVAFASLRSAAESLVNNLMQRRGAQHQAPGLSKPASMPGSQPADVAAAPADSAPEPVDTAAEPIGAALAPAATADETAVTASAPAETMDALADIPAASDSLAAERGDTAVEPTVTAVAPTEPAGETAETAQADAADATVAAPTDAAVEPTGGFVAPGEIKVAPSDSGLRSILGAALSGGLGGALDAKSRSSAGASNQEAIAGRAKVAHAEIAQPKERELSFPQVAPSHVQVFNAVYRRRPVLSATIGGRQISILAAWPSPDRRQDVSHRLALRLDGEPGELWLPQALLDVLVASVDPALSLDRLGPARAAIILEFALDSILEAVEMTLGCQVAVDSFSGQVEHLENDGQPPLFFTVVIEGLVSTVCELRIHPDYALRLAEGLDRYAGISRSALDLPLPVCLRVAAANLAASEIERLSPDDVVLVDASCQPGHAVIAVIGERLVAPVALTPEGLSLAAHPIPGATSPWSWSMPADAMAAAWEADAETGNRPLHVLFEIGRFELPASKVKQLAPNALLPLQPLQDQTVDIVVNGQRIGRGTLMQIGNRTGVRVVTVRERSRPAPGLKRTPAGETSSSQ